MTFLFPAIVLSEKIPFYEYYLTFPILSSNYYGEDDFWKTDKNNAPITTGRFQISEHPGNKLILTKNPNWWNKENDDSVIETVTINFYSSVAELYNAFKLGGIDLISTKNKDYKQYIGKIGYNIAEIEGRNFSFVALNTKSSILSDINVRKAIRAGINKDVIVTTSYNATETIREVSEFGVNWNKVSVSMKRIAEILNNELYQDEKFGNKTLKEKDCTVSFNDVYFKYRPEEELILKGLTMEIEPHKKIAIVGKSGQGKSTVFNLLLRYFDTTDGSITVNGIDIKDLSEKALRDNISVIRQNPYLFNQTIMENFKVLKPKVTLEEVRNVCKKAYIDDYIMSLPNGYDTLIGEGGVNLSGGQKQRLAIARTLLKDTKVILFDEATSALDNESQEYIKKTIDDLVKTHTIIIVAHRLSTIQDSEDRKSVV
mgnify:CR=1 FL=1